MKTHRYLLQIILLHPYTLNTLIELNAGVQVIFMFLPQVLTSRPCTNQRSCQDFWRADLWNYPSTTPLTPSFHPHPQVTTHQKRMKRVLSWEETEGKKWENRTKIIKRKSITCCLKKSICALRYSCPNTCQYS